MNMLESKPNIKSLRSAPTTIGTSNAAQRRLNEKLQEQGPQTALLPPATPLDGMLMQMAMHRSWYWHQKENNHDGLYAANGRPWPPRSIPALVGWTVAMRAQGRIK